MSEDCVLVEVHENIGREGVIVELRPEEHDYPAERDMQHLSESEARDLFEKLRQVVGEDASILGACENCEKLLREGENVELSTGTYCQDCAERRDEEPLVTDGGITSDELYEAAIEAWGEDAQINLLGEESAELSAEVSRFVRGRSDVADLAEEVADAEIMIEQARLILGERAIKEARVKKLNRLLRRLREAGSDV
jgi:hypothetical protein